MASFLSKRSLSIMVNHNDDSDSELNNKKQKVTDMNSQLLKLITNYFNNNGAQKYAKEICVNLLQSIKESTIINKQDYTTDESVHQFSENVKEHVTTADDNEYLKILENYFLKHFKVNVQSPYGYKKIQTHSINVEKKSEKIFGESYVYLYTDTDGKFNKMYIINGGTKNTTCIFSIFQIIREIAIQQYVQYLTLTKCKGFTGTRGVVKPQSSVDVDERSSSKSMDDKGMQFVVPVITFSAQTISFDSNETIIINLNMEKIQFIQNKQEYIRTVFPEDTGFQNRVNLHKIIAKFLDCLELNGVKHKDTHNENIEFLHDSGNTPVEFKLALLDFGKATVSSDFTTTSTTTGIPRLPISYVNATSVDNEFYDYTKINDQVPITEQSKAIDELMKKWLNHRNIQVDNKDSTISRGDTIFGFMGIARYGGKNKRTKKSRKQKKRIPIKKRKTRKSLL